MASLPIAMAAPLLAAPVQRLIQMATEATVGAALERIKLINGVRQEREKLLSLLRKVNILLAERNSSQHALVQNHLDELSDLVADAEDVLDEFRTDAARQTRTTWWSNLSDRLVRTPVYKLQSANQLQLLWRKLEDILDACSKLGIRIVLDINAGVTLRDNSYFPRRPENTITTGLPHYGEHFISREGERRRIMEWLRLKEDKDESSTSVWDDSDSVFTISGVGGMGKTSLAQVVYNDERVKAFFPHRMWVCVSNHFDNRRILRDMLDQINGGGRSEAADNPSVVESSIRDKTKGKRFLLVLDDVWKFDGNWSDILSPLSEAKWGSKVLVTTRDGNIAWEATHHRKKHTIHLRDLPEDDVLSILEHHALCGRTDRNDIHGFCKRISNMLWGSPLAAKTVGGLLNSKFGDTQYWESVVDTVEQGYFERLPPHPAGHEDIMSVLKISYERLPPHLKECFAYCSLFPQDHMFEKGELVQLWMAQGFVKSEGEMPGLDLEYWGGKHLDDLVSLSLLEKRDGYAVPLYAMHDLFHELAKSVSDHIFVASENPDNLHGTSPRKIRHVSWLGGRSLCVVSTSLEKDGGLRSLYVRPSEPIPNVDKSLNRDVSTKLKRLRMLRLENYRRIELPTSISKLKLLRYLYLSPIDELVLPESLVELPNLQLFRVHFIHRNNGFKKLPEQIGKLTELRHLQVNFCDDLSRVPESLVQLTNLRCLDLSNTSISELPKDMHELSNLVNLNLCGCEHLRRLPDTIGGLTKLKNLDISYCDSLEELPASITELRAAGCDVVLPDKFC